MDDEKYWIIAEESDRELLESLGVTVGPYSQEETEFQHCTIPDGFDQQWGRFYWGPEKE